MTDLSVIEDYICRIHKDAHENYPQNFDHIVELYRTDLNDIKIKLEILLPQADIKLIPDKNDKITILSILILTEKLLSDGKSDDFGEYSRMGLTIDPKCYTFLARQLF